MSLSPAEFQTLYTDYGPAVRARCRAICGNEADADEALQESFLRAWKARRRFDGRYPLAWLQTIARNTSLDILRKRRPWQDDPLTWLSLPAPERGSAGSQLDVRRLLDRFGAQDAALLRLRLGEGWRIREIAEHFDTSQRSIRRDLTRLEARARALLGTDTLTLATEASP
ncbi:MAG: RNA polymerase sigma-70 factor (ECF subfamily) [Myxococcota bacterium]|jgi:RNA polymerase sigma-70 factor (ECF subfamily)